MKVRQLNHVAIHVKNVEKSIDFYKNILGLSLMLRPAFDFKGAWFRLGHDQELHIIEGRTEPVVNDRQGAHFALKVDSLASFGEILKVNNIDHYPPKQRPDGLTQLFLIDPDGYFIELSE